MLRDLTTKSFSVLFSAVPRWMGPLAYGRPIVHHVDRLPFVRLADAVVNPHLLPMFEHFRLVLRQVRLHGEVGLGQIQR